MTGTEQAQPHQITDSARADRLAYYMLKSMNKTIRKYRMLLNGDRLLVAVSGGKDSLSLLDLLYRRRRSARERVTVIACHVRSDHHCGQAVPEEWLTNYCLERAIPLHTVPITVAETLSKAKRSRCFWCSYRRRTALFQLADQLGCNRIALGHHADDIAQTTLMNLCFSGRVQRMEPKQVLFKGRLTLIRPLAMTEERDIADLARASGFPVGGEPCPDGINSRRTLIKNVLRELEADSIDVKRSIFHAVERCQRAMQSTQAEQTPSDWEQEQEEDHV